MASGGEIDRAVGANVRRLREARGGDVEGLAVQVGLEPAKLAAAEAGARRLSATELFRLAQALSARAADFFKGLTAPGPLVFELVDERGEGGRRVELDRR